PIREIDHITPVHAGGHTYVDNGQGKCRTCNQVKEFPGWHTAVTSDGDIDLTTPTGHRYTSSPPPAPESDPWPDERDRP
ncbi:HNH endonuclease, partial [Escherichia coli]|nr:HNH endonuclease [Escherichia coli]